MSEVSEFWRMPDDRLDELLRDIDGERVLLRDEVQEALERFRGLELRGFLTRGEVERLHRAIRQWEDEGLDVGEMRLLLRDLEGRSRIRRDESLMIALMAALTGFYLRSSEQAVAAFDGIVNAVYLREGGTAVPPDAGELLRLPLPDGGQFDEDQFTDARYRARQLCKEAAASQAQGRPLDVDTPAFRRLLDAQGRWQAGYYGKVMTAITGYTVAQAFRDAGVEAYQFIAVIDERTTKECRALHRKVFKMSDLKLGVNAPPIYPPPHPCRSIIRAVAVGAEQVGRSVGDAEPTEAHSYRLVGHIDIRDEKAVQSVIEAFEKRYVSAKIEHCLVITRDGDVYHVRGDASTVDTTLLGELMRGSINTHNHPIGETQFSFSHESDLRGFLEDGSAVMRGFDEKYAYEIRRTDKTLGLSEYDQYNRNAYVNAIVAMQRDGIPDELVDQFSQHYRIAYLCDQLNLEYARWENGNL